MDNKHITVAASYPAPGHLNLVFSPPLQTWRFPSHRREYEGRSLALDACRKAIRNQSPGNDADAPLTQIEAAVEAVLASLVEEGTITLP
jgi:hypothetical protein